MFDPFLFVQNRIAGKRVTMDETIDFSSYNVLAVLSSDVSLVPCVSALNTIGFTKLPKDVQAKIFNGFNHIYMDTRWGRAKAADVAQREHLIKKIMAVYGTTYNTAVYHLDCGRIDVDFVNEKYAFKVEHVAPPPAKKAKSKK